MTRNTTSWQEIKEELLATLKILGYTTLGSIVLIGVGYAYIRLFV